MNIYKATTELKTQKGVAAQFKEEEELMGYFESTAITQGNFDFGMDDNKNTQHGQLYPLSCNNLQWSINRKNAESK